MDRIKAAAALIKKIFHSTLIWSVCLLLIVFACVLAFLTINLRSEIRSQIIDRDADVLYSVSLMEMASLESRGKALLNSSDLKLTKVLPPLVRSSELRGVIGLRVFDQDGRFLFSLPDNLAPADLKLQEVSHISGKNTLSRFHPRVWLNTLFADPFSELINSPVPLLEVLIPLHTPRSTKVFGVAQYWIDGDSTREQFDLLDKRLFFEAQIIFWGTSLLIVFILSWAFRTLQKSNRLLEKRTKGLQAANRELTITAKTSAIGAISANLIHGIKNPLAGLMEFMANQEMLKRDEEPDGNGDWEVAAETTRHIHDLIHELIALIREEENDQEQYDLSMIDVCDMVNEKARIHLVNTKVSFEIDPAPEFILPNRTGNLTKLILDNLVQNAIEASLPDGKALVRFKPRNTGLQIQIIDHGPGLPDHLKENPFVTCISSKPNGNGIGLAISYHISRYIGAKLSLEYTGKNKTCFSLFLPSELQTL